MLTIHGVPLSVHTRKVIVTAILKGIDHAVDPVIPFDPPQGWRDLSPTGLIPAITDGGYRLADSAAICQYLERRHPDPAVLPADPQDLGRALWLEAYAGDTLFRDVVRPLFFQNVIRPRMQQLPTDQAIVDAVLATAMPAAFRYLETQAGRRFLVGNSLTLADIAVTSNLVNYRYLGYAIDPQAFPQLAGYHDRMIAHPAFARALAAERPFVERMGLDGAFIG